MNFWELMIKKDDIILSFIEGIRKLIYATDRQIQKARKEMAKRPIEGIGKELYLLLNAFIKDTRYKCSQRKKYNVCQSWLHASII